ncbi:MAG TPA: Clp protease N-terminal domain-containing protein [Mycobacteriales bacterium]
MFERFTDGSRRAVVLAQESATGLHHSSITVEHLLLGIAAAHEGAGTAALADLGATPDRLRQAVQKVVPEDRDAVTCGDGHVPFTPAAKKAMEYSLQEATRRDHEAIDNGHLLLALLRQGGDELPAVLAAAGLDRAALGPAVERQLAGRGRHSPGPSRPGDGPGPAPHRDQGQRIEALLTEVLARLDRIEARLDRPGAS